jgi:hypothetical protein
MELIILTVFTVAFALWCAADDAEEIAQGKYIRHKLQWVLRAIVVGVPCLLLGVPFFAIGLAFLFSAVFRFRLNRLRGLDWRYVSPSNWYDYLFLMASCAWWWKPRKWSSWKNWWSFMQQGHLGYYLDGEYAKQVHYAGAIAYGVEIVIAFLCIFGS